MRLLLDTHVFLWWDENQLPRAAVQAIQSADVVYASAASAWEIAIKARLGKLETRTPFAAAIADYGFLALPISMQHADVVRSLPLHHRDPFDRMLVAQAQSERLVLMTHDAAFRDYDVDVLWVPKKSPAGTKRTRRS